MQRNNCSYYLVLPVSVLPSASVQQLILVREGLYTPTPLKLVKMVQRAVASCTRAGVVVRGSTVGSAFTPLPLTWEMHVCLMPPEDVQGPCIVVAGNLLQFFAHRTLARLSTADGIDKDEEAYRVPRGKKYGTPHVFVKPCWHVSWSTWCCRRLVRAGFLSALPRRGSDLWRHRLSPRAALSDCLAGFRVGGAHSS